MSCEPVTRETDAPAQANPQPIKKVDIEQVIEVVRRDSQTDAEKYLEDTVVPHGGE